MKRILPALLLLLGGCYDFAGLSSQFGHDGAMAVDLAVADAPQPPPDLAMADLAKPPPDLAMADFTGMKLPDLVSTDMAMASPQDMAMTKPPDMVVVTPPDMAMAAPQDMAMATPQDMAMAMPADMAMMAPQDMAMMAPQDMAIMVIPVDLAMKPDLVVAATCNDGIKNGSETDVDCGGGTCAGCVNFKTCKVNADCQSGYCPAGTCAVAPTCNDGVRNGNESDIDCGGGTCAGCVFGKVCNVGTDCASKNCVNGKCALPLYCSNGAKDGDETDTDCGGPTCTRCVAGKNCLINADCTTLVCTGGKCGTGIGFNKLSFASQVVYKLTANSGPNCIATADFNVDGTLDLCEETGCRPLVWSPLAGGRLTGSIVALDADAVVEATADIAVGERRPVGEQDRRDRSQQRRYAVEPDARERPRHAHRLADVHRSRLQPVDADRLLVAAHLLEADVDVVAGLDHLLGRLREARFVAIDRRDVEEPRQERDQAYEQKGCGGMFMRSRRKIDQRPEAQA